jgi:undecaprenyl diphosphate synthase
MACSAAFGWACFAARGFNCQTLHHIAIVMDGNGRWAKRRFLPRIAGHRQGVESLRRCIRGLRAKRGVGVLTVFAFSSENWNRPQDEVSGLMELLGKALVARGAAAVQGRACACILSATGRACPSARCGKAWTQAEAATADNTRLVLNVCFNYGGRWDIAQAASHWPRAARPSPKPAWIAPWRWRMCPIPIC